MSLIIGIGGCSRSGKTTLAEALVWHFRSEQNKTALALHQDDFVRPTDQMPLVRNQPDWETPASIDFEKLTDTLLFLAARFDMVVLEGLFAFNNATLNQLYHYQLFVEISEATFYRRRQASQRWGIEPTWYLDHVWQSFLKHGQRPASAQTVSGEQPFDLTALRLKT